jgi:hypothetical protein
MLLIVHPRLYSVPTVGLLPLIRLDIAYTLMYSVQSLAMRRFYPTLGDARLHLPVLC